LHRLGQKHAERDRLLLDWAVHSHACDLMTAPRMSQQLWRALLNRRDPIRHRSARGHYKEIGSGGLPGLTQQFIGSTRLKPLGGLALKRNRHSRSISGETTQSETERAMTARSPCCRVAKRLCRARVLCIYCYRAINPNQLQISVFKEHGS